jgi:hypothetical protein
VRFVVATAAEAVAAAVLLPGARPGIGVALVAALVAVAIGSRPWPLAFAAVPVLRDAQWLVALDLAAGVLLTSLVLAGGETLGQLSRGAALFVTRLPRVPRLVPVPEARRLGPAAYGTALGGALAVPFGALFWSADGAFAAVVERALPVDDLLPARGLVLVGVGLLTVGLYAAAHEGPARVGGDPRLRLDRTETSIALGVLSALFLAFVLVQLTVLFGGHDRVLRTAGLTYAEYARSGFWELLAVAGLTLVVMAAARRWGDAPRPLLALLAGLCLVVVASSLRRMGLYEDAYGFTRLRLSVQAIDIWLGGLLLLALAPARFAPRAAVAWTGVALAGFTLANPDLVIARHNVDRWRATGRLDARYLESLSADAAPALRGVPGVEVPRRRPGPWSSWSLAG